MGVHLCLGLALETLDTRTLISENSVNPIEDVSFPARDGLTLRGWWIPVVPTLALPRRTTGEGESDRAVIFLHGHGGSMDPDAQHAPAFHAAGFSVLMFDFRAHGRSEGQVSTIGYLERQDALGAVDFVKAKGVCRIGLLGFSMGGVVAMLAAPICPDVRAVISDGGPARLMSAVTGWGPGAETAALAFGGGRVAHAGGYVAAIAGEPVSLRAGALGGANRAAPDFLHPRRARPVPSAEGFRRAGVRGESAERSVARARGRASDGGSALPGRISPPGCRMF